LEENPVNTNSSSYYVRIDRHVRGPFSREVLSSMFDRGRITSETLVSKDRNSWCSLCELGDDFAGGDAATSQPGSGDFAAGSNQYFCTIDGITQGPLHIDELQRLVASSRLEPNDQVWEEGRPEWTAARNIPGLAFPSQPEQARSWIKSQPALFASLALILLLLFGLPTYYVLASAAARQAEKLAMEERLKEEEQKKREDEAIEKKNKLDERRHQELLEQNRMEHEEKMAAMGAPRSRFQVDGNLSLPISGQSTPAPGSAPPASSFSVGVSVHGKGWSGEVKRVENGQYVVSITSSVNDLYKAGKEFLFRESDLQQGK
jgi:hypothetical protein